ncbi:TENX protein, partial [Indicator maculatus]|nr:TENX protein [Indicator maculatus]
SQPRLGELSVAQVTPGSVQLEWNVLEGSFDSFTVQYRDGQGQPQALAVDGGSRTVTVPGLAPSRRYKFHLYGVWGRRRVGLTSTEAVTGEGSSGPHMAPLRAMFDILHCDLSPAAPADEEPTTKPTLGELRTSQVSSESVQLERSVPEGSFDSFTVQYRDAQGQPQVLPVDGGSRTVTVPGLSPSRRYKFNLYGVWGRKRLGPVSTDAATGEGPCRPQLYPSGLALYKKPITKPILGELRASQISPESVQLEWSVPEGSFDSFTVQYRDAQGQPQVLPVDGGSRTVTVP